MREQLNLFGEKKYNNKTLVQVIINGEIKTIKINRKVFSIAQAKKIAADIVKGKKYYNGQWIKFGKIIWNDKVYEEDTEY